MVDIRENERQRAYRQRCQAIQDPQPVDDRVKLADVRYRIDCYLAGDPEGLCVFNCLSWAPRHAGLMLARDYVTGKTTAPAFIAQTKADFGDAYVSALLSAGVLRGAPPEPDYGDLEAELHLETLKAYSSLVDPEPIPEEECGRLARPASVMCFRYLDVFHELVGLPLVSELPRTDWTVWSEEERDVLESSAFDEFAIADRTERRKYEALLNVVTTPERL